MRRCAEMCRTWSEVLQIEFEVKNGLNIILLGVTLNQHTRASLTVGFEGYICWLRFIEKLIYFVHISHNLMNSSAKYVISRQNPHVKSARIVINQFLMCKMRSPLELNHIEVIFNAHGDSVWSTRPPGTSSVGFEQSFAEDIMLSTCKDPQIVIKSLFPIICVNGATDSLYPVLN